MASSRTCAECGAPVAADQRYCLTCGARTGSRPPALQSLLRNVAANQRAQADPPAAPARAAEAGAGDRNPSRIPNLRLPSPRVCALLVVAFLGFGVLLGSAASERVEDTLAANAGSRLRLVLPSTSAATGSTGAAGSGSTSGSAGGEPPAAAAETTPTETTTAAGPATSSKKSSSSESEGGEESESSSSSSSEANGPATKLPPIKHVFVIMLSDEPYASVFGPSSTAHYLSQTLEKKGELLVRYDAVAHEELAGEVALLSGQGPTAETAANCPTYANVAPTGAGADGQVLGNGCVYPPATQTLAGQLTAKHLSWRAYVEGIEASSTHAEACAHPMLGAPDPTATQTASSGAYATFRNPFVYFHSVTDSSACAADDVGIAHLKSDLASAKRTPSFLYIAPDRCHDGNPTPCTPGAPAGVGPADSFLKGVVPEILASAAYKEGGLLAITVDEAPSSGEFADSSSCCGQPRFPNVASTAPAGLAPRGGGTVGALLISRYVKAGATTQEEFNHFSLLRTIEDLFALKHLGYAGLAAVKSLPPALFTAKPSP